MSFYPDYANNTISSLVTDQLPEYVSENYPQFVSFLQAYYEYLEQKGKLVNVLKNFPNYIDVDYVVENEIQGFVDSFQQMYMSQIPKNILADKAKLLKHIKTFYSSRGTTKSYQLLFRILFNESIDNLLNTGTQVLKASAGKWYQPTVLRVEPIVTSFVNNLTVNGLILGSSTLGSAPLGYSIVNSSGSELILGTSALGSASLGSTSVEYSFDNLSDWINLQIFGQSSYASAVVSAVDTNFQFNIQYDELTISNITKQFLPNEIITATTPSGNVISATLLGIVPSITIVNHGNRYNIGDPVLIVGGGGANASAIISQVSTGSIIGIGLSATGSGIQTYPNFTLNVTGSQTPAVAHITSVDTSGLISPNSYNINTDLLANNNNYSLIASSPEGFISNTWNIVTYGNCGPIQVVTVLSGGSFSGNPSITMNQNIPIGNTNLNINQLGAIGSFKIINSGQNYAVNDDIKIISTLSRGVAAGGIVTKVDSSGGIAAAYVALPSIDGVVNVISGSNTIIGVGTKFTSELWANNDASYPGSGSYITVNGETHRVTNITDDTTLQVDNNFISSAIKQALRLEGFTLGGFGYEQFDLPYNVICSVNSEYGTGAIIEADSILGEGASFIPTAGNYGQILEIKMDSYGDHYTSAPEINLTNSGDGTATAKAAVIGGQFQYPGYYLNEDGMLSARRYLEDASNYNNYTYKLESNVAVKAYYDLVYNLLNPAGMNMQCITKIYAITDNEQDINNGSATYINLGSIIFDQIDLDFILDYSVLSGSLPGVDLDTDFVVSYSHVS